MKRCTRCEEVQPVAAFYRTRAEAARSICKGCMRGDRRARAAAGLTQAAERARYHASASKRATVAAGTRRWKARNPEKLRAEYAVAKAIRQGRLQRLPCTVCGVKAQAHHADYTKPLEVQWLCAWHHARQHVAEGRLDHLRAAT